MSFDCKICGKPCKNKLSLVQHTENVHSRVGVHEGIRAWERYRNQDGEITTGREVGQYNYVIDDSFYNFDDDCWECRICNRGFRRQGQLEQHLNSGTHEDIRYQCRECYRGFSTLGSLTQHLYNSGHSPREERLIDTAVGDAQRGRTLMITNGEAQPHYEATLNFDGACNPNPGRGAAGWVLVDDRGRDMERAGRKVPIPLGFTKVTSNQAEYYALIQGLEAAIKWGVRRLQVLGDSKLVIDQMTGVWNCDSPNLIGYHNTAKTLQRSFHCIKFQHIPRELNEDADRLAYQTLFT